MSKLTEKQNALIAHSLGAIYTDGNFQSNNGEYYRNRFCASETHGELPILISLEEKGFMKRGRKINNGRDTLWYVTDSGIKAFKSNNK